MNSKMNMLDTIALKNLMVLSKHRDNEGETQVKHWFVEGPYLKVMEDEYDGGLTPVSLEYPIFLTFQRLLMFLGDMDRHMFGRYIEKEILILMEHGLETCYQILQMVGKKEDESSQRLIVFLKEVDDRHSVLYELHHKDRFCHRVSLWFGSYFDEFVMMLAESKRYLYFSPDDLPITTEMISTDEEEDDEDTEDEDDKKEC